MDIESYNSVKQDAQLLLTLPEYYRSAIYENHITLWFSNHVVVRITDAELPKLAYEFQRLDKTPAWFATAVGSVLRKRYKKKHTNPVLVKAAQLYSSNPAVSKLVEKITADLTAAELLGT